MRPLRASAEKLAKDGILQRHTDILEVAGGAVRRVEKQQRGTHADEIETSMMLYIAPDRVNMARAVRDDSPDVPGPSTRTRGGKGLYSASGIWGDATLGTREKGEVVVAGHREGHPARHRGGQGGTPIFRARRAERAGGAWRSRGDAAKVAPR